jgi:uncharacterized protein YdaU (DUF1376 family)
MSKKQASITKWMPLWIGDVRRECMGQPPEFFGMYVNLLMAAWENDGHLDDDERKLCRISGGSNEQWIEHRQALANLFVPRKGVWSHNLLREELHKAHNISIRRKDAGIKGNQARWGAEREAKLATERLMAQITADGGAL